MNKLSGRQISYHERATGTFYAAPGHWPEQQMHAAIADRFGWVAAESVRHVTHTHARATLASEGEGKPVTLAWVTWPGGI